MLIETFDPGWGGLRGSRENTRWTFANISIVLLGQVAEGWPVCISCLGRLVDFS